MLPTQNTKVEIDEVAVANEAAAVVADKTEVHDQKETTLQPCLLRTYHGPLPKIPSWNVLEQMSR